jgi:mannose-6-phosphate isomerase-like protein (cupin superfamily)
MTMTLQRGLLPALSFAALSLGLGATQAGAQDAPQTRYVPAKELRAAVAKTTAGLAVYTVPTGKGAPLLMVRREADGEVELHDIINDEFVAHSGHASVMVGGRAEGQRQSAPNEWRGGALTGGEVYDLQPGDVIWIPAGVPHQIRVPQGGSFEYLAFKFPLAAAASR